MTGKLLVAIAIVTLSASAASAAHHRHHHALNPAATPASPSPMGWTGGPTSSDHAMYLQNLHDSGYNPKNDRDAAGNMAAQ
ncbi:hypothetical protein [Bradyrhizobium sp. DOA1]|uniref:hypothetical protein n=1 Tax=Bradyrhizobium sp. DOA1 TaxID=1126616 RepID=UPI000A3E5EFF|nr:hypothetical protein [Bradyrhizobium sp. DOA1]